MPVTSGFYDSLNGDRKYNSLQMSSIFDGIIRDGVYASIGNRFAVYANGGKSIRVGTGRAWFNHTWILNDEDLYLELNDSDLALDRIDAIAISVNRAAEARKAEIVVVSGTAASSPQPPVFDSTTNQDEKSAVSQHPIAYIRRPAGSQVVNQGDITYVVGYNSTPYVTSPLTSISIEPYIQQWNQQWGDWFKSYTHSAENQIIVWENDTKGAVEAWFNQIKGLLSGDAAANLASKLAEIDKILTQLKTSHSMDDTILDSKGDTILDNHGNPIGARVVFGTSSTSITNGGTVDTTGSGGLSLTPDPINDGLFIVS